MRDRKKFWDNDPIVALLLCSLILFSAATLDRNIQPQTADATVLDPCGETLSLSKITGAAASITSPYKAVDVNFKTMWTSEGKGSWIKPDLGEKQSICHVDIDWYRGIARQYDFTIFVSSDGSTWQPVYSGKSDGISRTFERYEFEDVDARWVKVSSNGNQYNMRNSIQELKVYGHKDVTTTPLPPSDNVPYRAIILPYISVDSQRDAYSGLKSYDMVALRVGAGTTVSPTHLELVRQLPAQIKGLEFRSISEITKFIQSGNKERITFIGYVPEPEHGTPQTEIDNIVQSVKQASVIVHNAGLKFELVPRLQHNLDHADDFGPYVDYYTIMGQSRQDKGVATFQSFISSVSANARSTNPNIKLIFAEVSTERNPSPGLTLQETFRQSTASVVGTSVNGASIWYNSIAQLGEVKSFLPWYAATYGRTSSPSVFISYPADGQSFPSGTTSVKISGTASDDSAITLVEASLNGGTFSTAAGTSSWSHVTGALSDGKSYTLTVRATDSTGNTGSAKVSFSVKMPTPEPAPSQKFYKATLNTWASETEQASLFKPYMTASDEAKLHVALNHEVTAAEYSLVESLPHREKGLEFGSIAEIRKYAPILAQKGYDYCDYDIEPGPNHTPQAEFDDFVNSIRTASSICRGAGLDFHCSPANWRLRQGDTIEQVAPHCDQLHFQFQVVQQDPARYLAFSKEFSARARAANPDIVLAIQLSTQQQAAPGMSLLETFKKDWTNVKPYIDGVTIWWANDSSSKAIMTEFMTWFNNFGRG